MGGSVTIKNKKCLILNHFIAPKSNILYLCSKPKNMDHPIILSNQQIGTRLGELRRGKGLSQAELAKSIAISRPSLAQIEQGNRKIDAVELQKLAIELGFSIDDFLSSDFSVQKSLKLGGAKETIVESVRNDTPKLDADKLAQVLLYILENCAGKPNVNERVVQYMLYFIDFNHYEVYEEQLSGASYLKTSSGPIVQDFEHFIQHWLDREMIQRFKTSFQGKTQIRYLPLVKAHLQLLKASEKEIIDKVIDQMSDWSQSLFSQYVNSDMPLKASKNGEMISYELVFYRDIPYSVRIYEDEKD